MSITDWIDLAKWVIGGAFSLLFFWTGRIQHKINKMEDAINKNKEAISVNEAKDEKLKQDVHVIINKQDKMFESLTQIGEQVAYIKGTLKTKGR